MKNTKKPSRRTPAAPPATSDDDASALRLPHSAALRIVAALEQYEGTHNLADGATTLPELRAFAARAWFTRSMNALADALRELRGEFDRGRTEPELEAETLSGAVLDTLSSYFSCVAEDGTWSADTFGGLRANLERELTQGVTVEELAELKALGDGAGVVRLKRTAQPEAIPGEEGGEIFASVVAAMQPAEEIHGPDGADYIALMEKIAAEATRRAQTYKATTYDAQAAVDAQPKSRATGDRFFSKAKGPASAPALTSREYWAGRRDVEVERCPDCGEPTHASESDDTGRCARCDLRRNPVAWPTPTSPTPARAPLRERIERAVRAFAKDQGAEIVGEIKITHIADGGTEEH